MAKRSREGNLAFWSIRLLQVLNILIILGSIAFLTFEIQFEPHPAEFGWSLIMIAIITMLSGLIGGISAGQPGCFFPHMFFIFVSLMGLISLSVLLFVRPDEVARKMLTFHISVSSAMHHLFIDAYFFSLLGFLQFLIFPLSCFVRKRSYINYYEHFDMPFQQPQLTVVQDSACNKTYTITSVATIESQHSDPETQTESSSAPRCNADAQTPLGHRMPKLSSVGAADRVSVSLSPEKEGPTDAQVQIRTPELLSKSLGDLRSTTSSSSSYPSSRNAEGGSRAEVVDVVESERRKPDNENHRLASSLDDHSRNPRFTSIDSAWSADDDDGRARGSISTSSSSISTNAGPDSSLSSSYECHYSVYKQCDVIRAPCSSEKRQKQNQQEEEDDVSSPGATVAHMNFQQALRLYVIV